MYKLTLAMFVLTSICCSLCAADAVALPSETQATLAKYDAAVQAAAAKARKELGAQMDAATKKGKLDMAIAIKEELAKLPKDGAEAHSSNEVIFYTLPDYKGQAVIIRAIGNVMNVVALGFPSDGLRSIKVPRGMKVTVYENEMGGGKSMVITQDTADLTLTMAPMTTSALLEKTP